MHMQNWYTDEHVPCNNNIAQLVQELLREFRGIGLLHAIPQIGLHAIPTKGQHCCSYILSKLRHTFQHRSNCTGDHRTPSIHKVFMSFGTDQPNICAFALIVVHDQQKVARTLNNSRFFRVRRNILCAMCDVACNTNFPLIRTRISVFRKEICQNYMN